MFAILFAVIEILFLKSMIKRLGLTNAITVVFIIFFFYCNAQVIDLLILGVELRGFESSGVLVDFSNPAFALTSGMYFLFMLGLYLSSLTIKQREKSDSFLSCFKFNVPKWAIVFLVLAMLSIALKNSFLSRTDIKFSGSLIDLLIHNALLFSFAFTIFNVKNLSRFLLITVWVAAITYAIFSYEREPLVFLFVIFLFRYKNKINYFIVAPIALLGLVVLTYFKAFYIIVLGVGDWDLFFQYVSEHSMSLSRLDPEASFTLLYDYFDSSPAFYEDYYFSYFESLLLEVSRIISGGEKYKTIGQQASNYYTNGEYGVASSMILESLLNFSFIGPFVIGVIACHLYKWLKFKFPYLYDTIDVLFILFFVSFVRTEFIVVLKIYILPFGILLSITRIILGQQIRGRYNLTSY